MLNKKKRIAELEAENHMLKKEIETLKSRLNGDKYCSNLCQRCIHAISYPSYCAIGGAYTAYMCELDNKCKDYEKAGDNNGKL